MKYFDKSFFRFTLGFLAIVAASLLIIAATSAYAASVAKISFTTEEQSIKPGVLSEAITIQTQDSSGTLLPTPETIDLQFSSDSTTGEFLNSAGNPVSLTMNKNTGNRSFYYRDTSLGTFTLNIKATGRDTGEVWEASQKIVVSDTGGAGAQTGEVLSANTESSPTSGQSATSGAVAPAYTSANSQLEVSIGTDRLTSPGSPISFQVSIKKNSVAANSALSFYWSYGDGNVGEGPLVTHMYKYPGEYVVVLNAKTGNTFAVSRLKVKVVEPNIALADKGEYVEVVNNTNAEINLFNWKVTSGGKGFIFQPDTIVLPKSKIQVDKSLFRMKGEPEGGVVLKNFLGGTVAIETPKVVATPVVFVESQNMVSEEAKGETAEYIEMVAEASSSEPMGAVIYESVQEHGLMARMLGFFQGLFD